MAFREIDKTKALAIVRIFETGKADGDYAAVAVLNDGAGVSFGINQFTHRSGALAKVVELYLENGGVVAGEVLTQRLPELNKPTLSSIESLANDEQFKKALKASAITSEMKAAQIRVAEKLYLRPATDECERLGFITPLALAVVFDSITHGSWEKLRDRVVAKPIPPVRPYITPAGELKWITEYVRRRDAWLSSIPRLAATRYRTRFFLNQIAIGNWELKLPMRVHGVRLSNEMIAANSAVEPTLQTSNNTNDQPQTNADEGVRVPTHHKTPQTPQAQPPEFLNRVEAGFNAVAEKYDQVERVVTAVADRTDRAKSLWATFLGTIWQTVWAIYGLLAGVPREVWLVVAILVGAITLMFLYRQIALGRIRENKA
ncbi:MAG TPA: chitosanase [Pyrinomonadaceae bacterium]|nr:chitosanase [Pyrinomonadaceae bacterium]